MALRRTWTLAALAAALVAVAPSAVAQTPLPEARTHIDPAGAADPEAPKLTHLESDTDAADVRRGYLYVRARCDAICDVEVTATTRIGRKQREVGTAIKRLPANKVRRIKLKIRSDVRRRLAAGQTFRFTAVPLPPFDG
jgi:hypothetical protein